MATTNKTAENKEPAIKKENNEIEELKKTIEMRNKENDELREMIKQLGEIIKATQTNNVKVEEKENIIVDNDLIYINNNSVGSQIITLDKQGKTSLKIFPQDKNRPIEKSYIKQAMQINQVRRLFEYGILEFCDTQYYKIYGIERKFDMSESNVEKLFSIENITQTVAELSKLFKKQDTSILKHELCYKTLDLVSKGILPIEETSTINVSLNKLFCSGTNANFNGLLSNLSIKRGEV